MKIWQLVTTHVQQEIAWDTRPQIGSTRKKSSKKHN